MQIERKRPFPENQVRKQERDSKRASDLVAQREAAKKQAVVNKAYYLEQGRKYHTTRVAQEQELIQAKRDAKVNGELLAEEEGKLLLVIRIKGINKVDPKRRKIMQLLRLRQLHNGVLLRNNKAIMNMLRKIEPYVTYGVPSMAVIRSLIYKRGYGKIEKQRIPLGSNYIVEKGLGEVGIRCIEDLVNEIATVGPQFKKANNFLWPFKLNSPKGGLNAKRTPYLNGGDHGPRGDNINNFAKRMM